MTADRGARRNGAGGRARPRAAVGKAARGSAPRDGVRPARAPAHRSAAGPRLRRALWAAAAGAALILAWGTAAFVQRAEIRLATLPALVNAALAAHHEPFVRLSHLPPALAEATVAVEDRSFWSNPGISLEGIARSALVDLASRSFAQGGSTITQELVRDELLGYQKTVARKLTEMAYALLATRRFPKRTILSLYLNEVNYGQGASGIAAAAQTYFGLPPADLSVAQCALLAGLPQDPAGLDPLVHPQAARLRQRTVLQAMVAVHYLSPAQASAAASAPLSLLPPG